MGKIKVDPQNLRAFASTLQGGLDGYTAATVTKDENSSYKGNKEASKKIDDLNKVAEEVKTTLTTFVGTINDFATAFEEKDKEL